MRLKDWLVIVLPLLARGDRCIDVEHYVDRVVLRHEQWNLKAYYTGRVLLDGTPDQVASVIALLEGARLIRSDGTRYAINLPIMTDDVPTIRAGVLTDQDIRSLCIGSGVEHPMISPYVDGLVRRVDDTPVISFGQSSCGYDVRCVPEWLEFTPEKKGDEPIDPKAFNAARVTRSIEGPVYRLPPNSCVLTRTVETFRMPFDVFGQCLGKSTYARCGLVVNVTPLEPGWIGQLVMELSNTTRRSLIVRAGEGIAQIIFHRLASRPATTYADRKGKYQDQTGITTAKV